MKKEKKRKRGFTLIELLAVIIILGILAIIAIPSVTSYIGSSNKSNYIDSAKSISSGARNLVNEEKLEIFDQDATYYIPAKRIHTENGIRSPYGEFTEAYVAVVLNEKGYRYYWISNDNTGHGIPYLTLIDELDVDLIQTDIKDIDIIERVKTTGVGNRDKIFILGDNDVWEEESRALVNTTGEAVSLSNVNNSAVCIPATKLNTSTCTNTSNIYGCGAAGYTGEYSTIIYGTLVNGTPKAGDAYDCKVAINSGYTDRFYYVKSDGDNSILIYNKSITKSAYDLSGENWHGPREGYKYLPSKNVWNNPKLIEPGTRKIYTNNGNESTTGGVIDSFTYIDKAARFLTYQEAQEACSKTSIESIGSLDNCNWLLENISFYENGSLDEYGYWLETPKSNDSSSVYEIMGTSSVYTNLSSYDEIFTVRPVITIKTSDLG